LTLPAKTIIDCNNDIPAEKPLHHQSSEGISSVCYEPIDIYRTENEIELRDYFYFDGLTSSPVGPDTPEAMIAVEGQL
jgi:hypothetical protein